MRTLMACTLLWISLAANGQNVGARLGDFFSAGSVTKTAYAADGSIIVGGAFDRVGTVARRNLVRFAANGSLDTVWMPNPDGLIRSLVVDPVGNVFVAGNFKTIAGVNRPGVAKFLAGTPYVLDTSFLPQLPQTSRTVDHLVRRSDGTVYVSYCEEGATCRIVRLDAQGTTMAGFDVTTNNAVFPMALTPDEQFLLIAGVATTVGGVSIPSRANIAKLDANTGAMSTGWIPFATGNGIVRVIIPDGPNHVLVAGTIPGGPDGLARIALADPGVADVGFGPDLGPATNVQVTELLRAPDNDLVIFGNFTLVDGMAWPSHTARLAPDGSVRAGWGANAPTGGVNSNTMAISSTGRVVNGRFARPTGPNRTTLFELSNSDGSDVGSLTGASFSAVGTFQRLLREPVSGRIFAGAGNLDEVNGRYSHPVLAFQPDLTPDPGWTSMLGSKVRLGGNLYLSTGVSSMIVGGFGFGSDGLQVPGLYRLNAADGSNNDWLPQASAGIGLSASAPTAVGVDEAGGFAYTLGINTDANGAAMPGGQFRRFALSNGLRDTGFLSTISLSGIAPLLLADGFVYIANVSAATATDNSTVVGLARFSTVGTGRADPSFKPFTAVTNMQAMAHDANFIYVGGSATLVRVSKQTGVIDSGWQPSARPTLGSFASMSVAADGSVFLAGSINLGCNGAAVQVARIQPGGHVDPTWRISLDGPANAVLALGANTLVAGGFRTVNGDAHDGLVRVGRSDNLFSDRYGDPLCVTP